MVPPGGWRFKVSKTNTTVIGSDWKDLVSAVKSHCKHNGIESYGVEEEIKESFRKEFPNINLNI